MQRNGENIAIYTRKSKYTGKGESTGNQLELCKAYIRNIYGEEYDNRRQVFEDEGFSGGDLNRPAFRRMMNDVRKRRYKAIIVYRLDRISRSVIDFANLIDVFQKYKVDFVSTMEKFDTGTPIGKAMLMIVMIFFLL